MEPDNDYPWCRLFADWPIEASHTARGYIYVYGSATMVQSLLAADLVDELLLTVEPIILGGGKTIFAQNGKAIPFTLKSTARASTGRRCADMFVLSSPSVPADSRYGGQLSRRR
ncbi:MAG: dihydrofolate reductase family protein [Pseudomonadales bacterium]